jgi:hypothetical protein
MSNPWEANELFGKMLGEYTDNGYRMGTLDERERIVGLLHTQHKAEHIAEPSGVCRACRILALITND